MPSPAPFVPRPKLGPEQKLVLGYLTARARGKAQYAKAAALQKELAVTVPAGKVVVLSDGRRYGIVDILKDVDVAKKMVFIDRYELQELKG